MVGELRAGARWSAVVVCKLRAELALRLLIFSRVSVLHPGFVSYVASTQVWLMGFWQNKGNMKIVLINLNKLPPA